MGFDFFLSKWALPLTDVIAKLHFIFCARQVTFMFSYCITPKDSLGSIVRHEFLSCFCNTVAVQFSLNFKCTAKLCKKYGKYDLTNAFKKFDNLLLFKDTKSI